MLINILSRKFYNILRHTHTHIAIAINEDHENYISKRMFTTCDCLSKNKPISHLVVFQEILFQSFQLQNPTLVWHWTCLLSSKILSYLLAFMYIANLLSY